MFNFIVTFTLVPLVTALGSLAYLTYCWYQAHNYTRERFAFGSAIFAVSSFITLFTFLPTLTSSVYQILSILILLTAYFVLFWSYKYWVGDISVLQHIRHQENLKDSPYLMLIDSLEFVKDAFREGKVTISKNNLTSFANDYRPLHWHLRVSELWNLKYPEYEFFENNWREKQKCWIVKRHQSVEYLVLVCLTADQNDHFLISDLVEYIEKQALIKSHVRIVIALEEAAGLVATKTPKVLSGYKVEYVTETQLLDDLVNFDSYIKYIRRTVSEKFTGLGLSLEQMYTVSDFKFTSDVRQPDVEAFILEWLSENSSRHLAILGEYGYGKTVLVQMLAYSLLQAYQQDKSVRIPIIIELRGKSPRNLSPEETFGTWKQGFGINPRAMMQLALAGRLLIIFDGFDEVDLAINKEIRLQHFKSLWLFAHDKAKVLFTGRTHLFFDINDLQRTQSFGLLSKTIPYCEMAYLQQFNIEQIKVCLRNLITLQINTREEILELAKTNSRFFEMVSRPAILRMIASIWKNLPQHKDKINSAYIIDLLIDKTIGLQLISESSQNNNDPVSLNSAERKYFLQGIAVYMAAKGLPNQITRHDLEQAIHKLVQFMPEKAIYSMLFNFELDQYRSLKSRLNFKQHPSKAIEYILTDIQADSLFVPDLTKPNSFKFAHKLFMELLAAKTYADWFMRAKLSKNKKRFANALKQAFKLTKADIVQSKEMRAFFIERLVLYFQGADASKHKAVSKTLLKKFIRPFYWVQKPFLWMASNFEERFNTYKTSSGLQQFLLPIASIFSELVLVVVAGGVIYKLIGIIPALFIVAGVILSIILGIGTLTGITLLSIILITIGGGWFSFEQLGILGLLLFFILQIVSLLRGFEVGSLWSRKNRLSDSLWANYALWYETCTALGIDRDTMAKVVGNRAMILFEDPPEKKD
ncbi:NACHT domain-containing protein [Candidatus Albibeggiatoa sp. nov. NOAA]|uniref:NACHT domain-containing protein n=1 Tax=Candidatus Albibeggiatoa sp. nov. NOAA TaxID=3162724 RepID=UPI0032F7E437|nr:NACHT domain-containing protein [Thiotrichaceae bacterium]